MKVIDILILHFIKQVIGQLDKVIEHENERMKVEKELEMLKKEVANIE